MEYLNLIISFITGGGLMVLANWKINKNNQKVDFADKAMKFMEVQNDMLMKRITDLEADVKKLWNFKCEKLECKNRQPPKI